MNEVKHLYVHVPFCAQHCSFCHYPGELGSCRTLREKQIVYLRYGLGNLPEGLTQRETAGKLGISRSYVSAVG